MKKAHSYEYVTAIFEKANCVLLSKAYKNNREKLGYLCNCGNISTISFDNFNRGRRCSKCKIQKIKDKQKFSYDYVHSFFLEQDCKLLSTTYENADSKLNYICNCGNHHSATFYHFKKGSRCPSCGSKKNVVNQRHSFEYVKDYFASKGCSLLSAVYINGHAKLDYTCKCGNNSSITFSSFKNGVRCKHCDLERKMGSTNPNYNHTLTVAERIKGRHYPEYYQWLKDVYSRDDYTCVKCREKGGILNAHHIVSYARHKTLRIKLSNGVTLCKACHTDFHSLYGNKTFTEGDFKEFMNTKFDIISA